MSYAKYSHENQSGYLLTSVAHLWKRQKAGQEKRKLRFRLVLVNVSLVIADMTYNILMKHGKLSKVN